MLEDVLAGVLGKVVCGHGLVETTMLPLLEMALHFVVVVADDVDGAGGVKVSSICRRSLFPTEEPVQRGS